MYDKFEIFETHIWSFEIKYSITNTYKTFQEIFFKNLYRTLNKFCFN